MKMNSVQVVFFCFIGDNIMNNKVTSKKEILSKAKEIIATDGLSAVSIRSLAKKCNMATGSLYNYFSSKDELILEVVKSVWEDVFDLSLIGDDSFVKAVEEIIKNIRKGKKDYPNFFKVHSLKFTENSKGGGRTFMTYFFVEIKSKLLFILKNDSNVNEDFFGESFTKENYVEVIFNIILSCFVKQLDEKLVVKMIEKTIY